MARISKFASVNLNESYGKPEHTGSAGAAANPSAPPRPRLPTQGGMLVLSRPSRTQSTGAKPAKLGIHSPSNLPTPKREHPVTDTSAPAAVSPLVTGWLKNPQQQQIEQSAPTAGSAALPETPRGRSGGSIIAAEAGSVRNLNGDSIVDGGSQSIVGRPNVYVPPSRRPLQANEDAAPRQPPPPPPEKAVVLRGEEFPTLQASLVRPPTPPQHQQRQREAHKKQREEVTEQQLKLQQLSQQAHVQKQTTGGEVLKLQPAQPMRSQMKHDFSVSEQLVTPTDGRYGEFRNADVCLSTLSPLVRLDHVSNWADDEREVGQALRSQGSNHSIIGGGRSDTETRQSGHSHDFEQSRTGLRVDLPEVDHREAPGYANYLRDTKRGEEEANATAGPSVNERASAGPSVNEREGNSIYVPPFAREGSFLRDQAPSRDGIFSRDQAPAKEGRDRGNERQEGYFVRGGGRPRDSGSRKEYSIGKEQFGREAFNQLEYSPDGNASLQNGAGGHSKRHSAGDADSAKRYYNKTSFSGGGTRFSPPDPFNQEMRFTRNYGHHPRAEDPPSSRSGARSGYDHRPSRGFYTDPWNARRDTDNFGSRRMASPANDGQFFASERESFEVEKCLEEERCKKGENKARDTRLEVSSFENDFGRTHRLLEEEKYTERGNKGSSTRIAPEKEIGHERSTMEESRYLHNVGFRGFVARTEQDTRVNWMLEEERSYEEERREAIFRKYTEQEESIAQREVEERTWRENSELKRKTDPLHMVGANYLSMMQQKEEAAKSSAETEWEFSGPGQRGNDFALRPSSANSSSSTQLSRPMAEDFSQHIHPTGAKNSIATGLLENKVGKESKSTRSKSPISWRKEINVSGNGPTSKLFSSPYIESTGAHRSTDSGSFKLV